MNHYDEMTCVQYLDGQLEAGKARELAAHVGACAECGRLLRALERESRLMREALGEADEPVPARVLAPPSEETTPWAWIVSFGLAAAGVYTLWTGVVEPWLAQFNQAGFSGGNLLAMVFFSGVFWKGWGEMQTLMELLAFGALAALGVAVFRRRWRRWTSVAVVLGVVGALLTLPPGVAAAEIKKGVKSYTLPAGETVHSDLIVGTRTARIDGTVEGDLLVFARSVTINGRVTGDLLTFAQTVRVNGQVEGDVRSWAQTLSLSGSVGKNVTAFVQTLECDAQARIGGSVASFSENLRVEGRVARDVSSAGENLELEGFIGGSAQLAGQDLTIGPGTEIQGKAKFQGRNQPVVASGAKLSSPLEVVIVKRGPKYKTFGFYKRQALLWGASFAFGLVLVVLMPGLFGEVVRASRRYGATLGFGLLGVVAVPVLAILACFTLVGIPVGVGALLLFIVAFYGAQVFVGATLGEMIAGKSGSTGAVLGRMAVGLLILRVLSVVIYGPVWAVFWALVAAWGLGALGVTIHARMRPQAAA